MNFLKVISVLLMAIAVTIGVIQIVQINHVAPNQQNIDIHLTQPGPPPPPQFDYLQCSPGSPLYFRFAAGWPPEYYTCPQFFFYYEPGIAFYRPGFSIFLGSGWWYTPGVGCINIGYFNPMSRPFSSYPAHPQNRIIHSTVNISNTHSVININRANEHVTPHHNPQPVPPHNPPHKK
jgi:hypothetical protein